VTLNITSLPTPTTESFEGLSSYTYSFNGPGGYTANMILGGASYALDLSSILVMSSSSSTNLQITFGVASGTSASASITLEGSGNLLPNGLVATLPPISAWNIMTSFIPLAGGADYGDFTINSVTGCGGAPSGLPAIAGVVSGASFQAGIVPGAWITIQGSNLAPQTDTWDSAIVNGMLPTALDGVSVNIAGEPAYIAYISPTQINAVAPIAPEGYANVVVTAPGAMSSAFSALVQSAQPSFFQWGNYAVATTQDYSLAVKNGTFRGVTTTPAKPGEVIILWGTGFGPTSPAAPAGVEVPTATTYNTANMVTITVGGQNATVYGAALAAGYAGLYQVAIQIPASLGNGDYPVIATVSGAQSPVTTLITVQD
jgi:uncharacterized protein (TIGR03437 family)